MTGPLVTTDTSDLSATIARNWHVQVREPGDSTWTFVRGINSFNGAPVSKTRQDSGDFHSGNWGSSTSTEATWALEIGIMRKIDASGEPDPGVEMCRAKDGELGTDEDLEVRWWRSDDLPDAYQGIAGVDFVSGAGDKTALTAATITLTGKGKRNTIAKPSTVAVSAITINPNTAGMVDGQTLDLVVRDQGGNDVTSSCTFATSAPLVAEVGPESGIVTATGTGSATITATYPGVTPDTAAITVS